MQVIATAGHVDHGKSSLLRALTSMEPDRWEEERRRGLTLDLGFVWTDDLAFVDVPGHEKFITNMLAGVGPVPAVLFVVAADRGWSAQSQEHLNILDALGIRHGLLAITKSDLADPALAMTEAAAALEGTSLEGTAALPVSSLTGEGVEELRTALASLSATLPHPDSDSDVRLWADRVFTVRGRGTVVTGTLPAGTIHTGDVFLAGDCEFRVRGLHSRQHPVESVSGPARVALNLRGTGTSELRRGVALVQRDRWLFTETVDVRLRPGLERSTHRLPQQGIWHMGAAALPTAIRPLGEDTARIRLAEALPLRIGDRALLRCPGRREVWGVTVLDVRPPELRRRGAGARRAAELTAYADTPDGAAEVRRRKFIRKSDLLAMGAAPPQPPVAGEWLADPAHWTTLQTRLTDLVVEHAALRPSAPGLSREEARRALDLPEAILVDALAVGTGLRQDKGRLKNAKTEVPPQISCAVAELCDEWATVPFAAPTSERLEKLGLGPTAIAVAEEAGLLLQLAPSLVLPPKAVDLAVEALRSLPQPFTASQARRTLNTSRRIVIPLLERLDQLGHTRRLSPTLRETTI